MKQFPWDVVLLAAVLAVNRLVVPMTFTRPALFWGIQALDVALAVAVAILGLPGLASFPQLGWIVAGLLAFHVFQNVALRSNALSRIRQQEAERERVKRLRALGPVEGGPSPDSPDDDADEPTRPA